MWLLGISLLPLLTSGAPTFDIATIHKDAAPILSSVDAKVIPDSYMVVFKDHVSRDVAFAHHSWVQDIHQSAKRSQFPFSLGSFSGLKHTYDIAGSLLGYSGHFNEETIEEIRRHPDVKYVERDSEVHTMLPEGTTSDDGKLENDAPWGLARISHREGLSFGNFNKYLYAKHGGEGVDVYIIDTGTNVKHLDFEGRASWGKTIPEGDEDEDGNGHGTHCSGTAAGHKYGVAKKANIKAVKVLRSNGSGSMSDVVKGVEYAAESHLEQVKAAKSGSKKGFKGSTANMSLGGGKSEILDKAVDAAVDAGIHFSVAAGNDNADACNYSPAASEKAVTVGASSLADERAYFSNFGECTDIFAPGLNILSTWIGGNNTVNTISGTSMASPHIAGLLAYYLSLQPSKDSAYAVADISPKELKDALISVATAGALEDVPADTPNLLAWNGGGKSNFTEIVAEGGYDVSKLGKIAVQIEEELEDINESIHEYAGKVKDMTMQESEKVRQELSHVEEDLVEYLTETLEKGEELINKELDRLDNQQFQMIDEL